MKERCPQRIFAKLPIHVWTQRTRRLRHRQPQGCSAPFLIDLGFTIVVKRFTVNGKFSQAATEFAKDPATFFWGKVGGRKSPPSDRTPVSNFFVCRRRSAFTRSRRDFRLLPRFL